MIRWNWLLRRQPPVPVFSLVTIVAFALVVIGRGRIVRGVPLIESRRSAVSNVEGQLQPDLDPASPPTFRVRLETSKGSIVIDVTRDWAPHGADRFYRLVKSGYYHDNRFFRVVKGQWAQFGINGDSKIANEWRARTIPDDPPRESNVRGTVAFAFAVPNGRATQVYIALTDLSARQDPQGFVPFGRVATGMEVADALNAEYGEAAGGGIRAGRQQPLFDGGNAYLDREFPRLDRILRATVSEGGAGARGRVGVRPPGFAQLPRQPSDEGRSRWVPSSDPTGPR
jgi:peptidyl-prolyl cis-trans isomerase A (cyclophilin A)